MALLYLKESAGTRYEVRSAGASVRLYSNGVLHSQYNKNTPINGAIWDLLLLPGFFLKAKPKRILVLGLGGGSIVHLLSLFFPDSKIVCIELDAEHIHISKEYFSIPQKNTQVIEGDAYQYLQSYKTPFDWIIDDVFQHVNGEAQRQKPLNELKALYLKNLIKSGLLSINLIAKEQTKQVKTLSENFESAYQFSHPLYENRIVALFNSGCSTAQFRENLRQYKILDQNLKSCRLNYRLRKF